MEEIKVGEYVKLNDGTIGKYNINKNWINVVETNNRYIGFDIETDVVKHSKNIIDLIEAGDILEVYFPIRKITKKIVVDEYFKDSMILNGINYRKIFLKTILTKEQFARESYKVEEE